MALCSVLAGFDGWDMMAEFVRTRRTWFEQYGLPATTPRADMFRSFLERLKPHAVVKVFVQWVDTLRQPLPAEAITIDGKSVRGAFEQASRSTPLHLLHMWVTTQKVGATSCGRSSS